MNNDRLIFDIQKTEELIKLFNNDLNEITEIFKNIESSYLLMDDKIWYSKEKKELDDILIPYFSKIKGYSESTGSFINLLTVYKDTIKLSNKVEFKKEG